MYKLKSLRISVLTFIFGFASILLLTISPISGSLKASAGNNILISGTTRIETPKPVSETPVKSDAPEKAAAPVKASAPKKAAAPKRAATPTKAAAPKKASVPKKTASPKNHAQAVFAMGCFWCAEKDFEKVAGVISVVSGYTGGTAKNPSYEQVSYTETGHYEAVLVTYDSDKVKYSDLLKTFWLNVDPFDDKGQFCDKGSSYKAAIFPKGKIELAAANASKDYLAKFFKKDLAPKVIKRSKFYPAEDYHQDFYKTNPRRYNQYRLGCRRDARLKEIWGTPKS